MSEEYRAEVSKGTATVQALLLPLVTGLKKMLDGAEGRYVDPEPISAVLERIRAADAAVPSGKAEDLSDEQVLAYAEASGWNWEGKEDEEEDEMGGGPAQPEVEYDTLKREELKAESLAMSTALQKPNGKLNGDEALAKAAKEFLDLQRSMWCDRTLRAFAIRQYLTIDMSLIKMVKDENATGSGGVTLETMAARSGILGDQAAREAGGPLNLVLETALAVDKEVEDATGGAEAVEKTVEATTIMVFAMLVTLRRFVGGPVQRINRANTAAMFRFFLSLTEGLSDLQPLIAKAAAEPARLEELRVKEAAKVNELTANALEAGVTAAELDITPEEEEEARQHMRDRQRALRPTPAEQARKEREALASWDPECKDDGGGGAGKAGKKGGKKKGKKGKKGGGGGKKKGGKKGGAGAMGAAGGGGAFTVDDSDSDGVVDDGEVWDADGVGSLLDMPSMQTPREAMRLSRRAALKLVQMLDHQGEIEGKSIRQLWAGVRGRGEPQLNEGQSERLLNELERMGWDDGQAIQMQKFLDAVGACVDCELGPARKKHRATFRRLVSLTSGAPSGPGMTASSTYVASSLIHACLLHHMDPGAEGRVAGKVLKAATRVLETYQTLVGCFAKDEYAALALAGTAEPEAAEPEGSAEECRAKCDQLDTAAIVAACAFEREMFEWAETNVRELAREQAETHASQAGLKKTLEDVKEKLSLFSMMGNQPGAGAAAREQARALRGASTSSSDLACQLEELMVRDGPEDLGQFVGAALTRGLRFQAFSREQLRERDPAALLAMWRVMPLEAVCKSLESQAQMQEEEPEQGEDSDDEIVATSVYASQTLRELFPQDRVQSTILAVEQVSPSAKLSHLITVLRAVAQKLFRSMDSDVADYATKLSLAGGAAAAKFDADITEIAKGVVAWCTELERSPQRQRMAAAVKLAVERIK
jgi:hypothetical protein